MHCSQESSSEIIICPHGMRIEHHLIHAAYVLLSCWYAACSHILLATVSWCCCCILVFLHPPRAVCEVWNSILLCFLGASLAVPPDVPLFFSPTAVGVRSLWPSLSRPLPQFSFPLSISAL